jgi:hypothetical protein
MHILYISALRTHKVKKKSGQNHCTYPAYRGAHFYFNEDNIFTFLFREMFSIYIRQLIKIVAALLEKNQFCFLVSF